MDGKLTSLFACGVESDLSGLGQALSASRVYLCALASVRKPQGPQTPNMDASGLFCYIWFKNVRALPFSVANPRAMRENAQRTITDAAQPPNPELQKRQYTLNHITQNRVNAIP